MPGVLLIETLAQAAANTYFEISRICRKTAYLGSISKAKFRKVVRPRCFKIKCRNEKETREHGDSRYSSYREWKESLYS